MNNLPMWTILFVIFLAVCAAGLTDLYSFALGDPAHSGPEGVKQGRIFSRFGRYLDQRYQDFEQITTELRASKERLATDEAAVKKARRYDRANPYKMMGVCPRCTNVWVLLLLFIPCQLLLPVPWLAVKVAVFFLCAGLSNILIGVVGKLR